MLTDSDKAQGVQHPTLFSTVRIGSLDLPSRVIMAPLTRARATVDGVPTEMMARYYAQRSDCGLIVSEATAVDPLGLGWHCAPGIWNDAMAAGWRRVTDAVHAAGGRIFSQLWHMGRLVLPEYLGGELPIGPSAVAAAGETIAPPPPGQADGLLPMKPYVVPREMKLADIGRVVESYRNAAHNAVMAGFDGVEIHAANGYIIDQFLQSKANYRSDAYGGSLQNRTRLLREIMEAVAQSVDPGRIGLRISPTSERKGMGDENPAALTHAVGVLSDQYNIAYVHLIEPVAPGFMKKPDHPVIDHLRAAYRGAVIQNGSFDAETADAVIAAGKADAVSFGRPYIANPDLMHRMRHGLPIAPVDLDHVYVGGERGYTDYPLYH